MVLIILALTGCSDQDLTTKTTQNEGYTSLPFPPHPNLKTAPLNQSFTKLYQEINKCSKTKIVVPYVFVPGALFRQKQLIENIDYASENIKNCKK